MNPAQTPSRGILLHGASLGTSLGIAWYCSMAWHPWHGLAWVGIANPRYPGNPIGTRGTKGTSEERAT
eukprot:8922874-Pyramimonas_sp.AAC.1